MAENIKVRWLVDHEQTKIAPKTLSTQILNEDGTQFKDTIEASIDAIDSKIDLHNSNSDIHVTPEEKASYATEEYVKNLYTTLNSNTVLAFYCIEDVTIVTNGIPKTYPANSNVEVRLVEGDTFEIIPTSDNSILSLSAFPNALGTFYSWLEGVAQFSNILFDMNDEDMYSKWSQGNQGSYHVQKAQYSNCIFWSDNPYISDVTRRTNYTLTHTSQLPLCYSTIPDNTFKSFYLAFGVNSDPNWGNNAYRDSFAKATWATQVFSYYGARTIGIVGHDDPDFNIVLPKDCRGLMFDSREIESAGTFDAINTTNFGAKAGSWREAFGDCSSLRRLYIKNLKVSLNISWSPIDYNSISYIISAAANTNAITISVSPYTYNLLSQSDFDLATSKNITIALITSNYVEDKRLSAITNKADANHTHDDLYYTKIEADTALNAKADANHNHDDLYDTKGAANTALETAQAYADSAADTAANKVKNDLLNGAGDAYDTLKELGDLIDVNVDAIEALGLVAAGKADKEHNHDGVYDTSGSANAALESAKAYADEKFAEIPAVDAYTKAEIDGYLANKADKEHTHDLSAYETKEDAQLKYDELNTNKSDSGHGHDVATVSASGFMSADMVTKLNSIEENANYTVVDADLSTTSSNPVANSIVTTAINNATSAIGANTNSITEHTTAISNLQTAVSAIQEITSEEIQTLFAER